MIKNEFNTDTNSRAYLGKFSIHRDGVASVWIMLIAVILIASLASCTPNSQVQVGINWHEETIMEGDLDWYLALAEGSYMDTWSQCMDPIYIRKVDAGSDCVENFNLLDENYSALTAFIFYDYNDNAMYDDGIDILTGFKPGWPDAHEEYFVQVSAYH